MPFGPDCEYADFDECVRKNGDRDNPKAYCAAIQRRTEEHCMDNRIRSTNLPAGFTTASMVDAILNQDLSRLVADDDHPRLRTVRRPVAKLNPRWYRITNKANDADTTLIDIYDEIGWFGVTAAEFVKDLRGVSTPKIELHINSPGGDVFDAIAIYNGLRQHDAQVHVVIDSLAASAASFIAMAGNKITATANAMLMIHDAMGLVIGNAVDMRTMADLLDKHSDNIASIYASRAGGDVADWRSRMADEVWYNAQEAHAAGLVDEVQGEGEPVTDTWDLSIFTRPPQRPSDQQQPAEAPPDDAPAPDDDPAQPDEPAHPEDAPQEPTATANGDGGRRHDYLGEPATWYLPPRKEHI